MVVETTTIWKCHSSLAISRIQQDRKPCLLINKVPRLSTTSLSFHLLATCALKTQRSSESKKIRSLAPYSPTIAMSVNLTRLPKAISSYETRFFKMIAALVWSYKRSRPRTPPLPSKSKSNILRIRLHRRRCQSHRVPNDSRGNMPPKTV